MRSKNKQILVKNVDNFFNWIKGAELVELKKCNTKYILLFKKVLLLHVFFTNY